MNSYISIATFMKQEYITEEGLEKIKAELEELKSGKREEVAEKLEEAKSRGDLSENAEYQEAREEQAFLEGKIAELEEFLRNAVVIEKPKKTGVIEIGTTFEVKSEGKTTTFTIVGSEEADPAEGKISNESPIGKAFLGRKAGEEVEISTPAGKKKYKIAKILD